MPRTAVDDNKRINLRLRPEQKATLLRAAALTHMDLTDFALQPALREAKAVIDAEVAGKTFCAECQAAGSHCRNAKSVADAGMRLPVSHQETILKNMIGRPSTVAILR
ncbi:MAG: DUF1778 domain-containing protein [Phycisphaerales bacterium]|nr:DUF1778 domain-containing protein [Phycisphaerales bacterium]